MAFTPNTGGTPSSIISSSIVQTAHGFSVGQWVYLVGTVYTLTDSNVSASTDSVGVVSQVIDANTFKITLSGKVTGLSGLTAGTRYFLSGTAGTLTATAPSNAKAVLIADSTTSGYVQQYASGGATTQALTWGQNYWFANGSMTNAVSSFAITTISLRETLAPVGNRIPMIGTTTPASGVFTGSGVTRDTVNNRLTITANGRYKISANIISSTASANESGVQLIKNGTTILTMSTRLHSAATPYLGADLAWEGDLVATDFVELRAWANVAGTFFHDGGTFIVSQQPTAVAPTVEGYSPIPLTYGRVNANTDLVNTTFNVLTSPGIKIPFNTTVYNSGTTFSGTDGIIPSVAGRFRASWLMIGGSGLFNGDGTLHVVQNGLSLGSVFYDMMEAAGVNQCAGFIDVNVAAGSVVTLNYQPVVADAIPWQKGSYFDLYQLSTAVAPIVDVIAENESLDLVSNVPIAGGNISAATGVTVLTFTLPSAGTWELTSLIKAQIPAGANSNIVAGVFDSLNSLVPGSDVITGMATITAGIQSTGTSNVIIEIAEAATYTIKAWNTFGFGGQINATPNGTTGVRWKKIAGGLPSTGQIVDYSGVEQHSVGTATNLTTVASTNVTTSGTLLTTASRVILTGANVVGNLVVNTTNGTIAIAKNGSYNIVVTVNTQSAGANGQWGQLVKNNTTVISASSAYNQISSASLQLVFNYTGSFVTGDLIDVRLNANSGGTIGITGYSYSVIQLGSSAYTTLNTFTGATSVLSGLAGGVIAPIAGEQNEFLRGNGTWSKPVFSGARRFASAATSIANSGAPILVTTGSVDYTAGTEVTTSTANTITISTNGFYRIMGSVGIGTGSTTSNYHVRLLVNGISVSQGGSVTSVADSQTMQSSITLILTAGDLVTLGCSQTSGSAQSTISGNGRTYLEVIFVGV